MSTVPPAADDVRLTVLSPDESLRHARPLPSDADMAIDGLTAEEPDAFEAALSLPRPDAGR